VTCDRGLVLKDCRSEFSVGFLLQIVFGLFVSLYSGDEIVYLSIVTLVKVGGLLIGIFLENWDTQEM
jgi:hypothetical protein